MFAVSNITEWVEAALRLNLPILVESTSKNWMLFIVDHFSSDSSNAIIHIWQNSKLANVLMEHNNNDKSYICSTYSKEFQDWQIGVAMLADLKWSSCTVYTGLGDGEWIPIGNEVFNHLSETSCQDGAWFLSCHSKTSLHLLFQRVNSDLVQTALKLEH